MPAPDDLRHLQRSLPASTGRQRGGENEALTASAPVAGEHITDMVINVKFIRHTSANPRRPALDAGQYFSSGASVPQGSGAPCQARATADIGVESGRWIGVENTGRNANATTPNFSRQRASLYTTRNAYRRAKDDQKN